MFGDLQGCNPVTRLSLKGSVGPFSGADFIETVALCSTLSGFILQAQVHRAPFRRFLGRAAALRPVLRGQGGTAGQCPYLGFHSPFLQPWGSSVSAWL